MKEGIQEYKFVPKGWGYEKWLVNFEKYCGKLLFLAKDRKLSWHKHLQKEETFYVLSGQCFCTFGWDEDIKKASGLILRPGDVFHVPVGLVHRLEALEDCQIVEFSTQHFDEDSIRIEKGD